MVNSAERLKRVGLFFFSVFNMKVCVPVLSRHMCALPWLWAGKMGLSAVVAFLRYIFSISLKQKACIIACVYICDRGFRCTW